MANSVSSLIKTIKSANSESLTLCCQIDKTFLFHLSLPFPGCFDVKVHRISDEFMDFHCCCDMLSNLLRNCRISDLMMNHQASMMAKPSSPFYMLPVFYVLLSPWLLLHCISKVIPIFHADRQFCTLQLP